MDLLDYPKEHDNHCVTNKKVLSKFKDEVHGKIIKEIIGLKSKMYAMDIQHDKEHYTVAKRP